MELVHTGTDASGLVDLAGTQTISGLKTFTAKQSFSDLVQVETSGTLYVKGITSLHGNTYAPRIVVRNDEGDGSQTGLMVTNDNTDGLDQSRRLGLFHYKGERTTAGSLLLVNVEKSDVAAVTTLAFEGQAATVQGTSAVASHLGGVAGINLHRSNGTITYARALITTTQVDCGAGNATPGTLTNAYGLFVDRPQTFSTGSIANFRGVYVSGNVDTGLDSAGTAYTPTTSWRGIHVALPPSGPSFVRALDIEGRSSFANTATGDVAIDASVIGDAQTRYRLYASGAMQWGTGAAAVDSTLQRRAAGVMEFASTAVKVGSFTLATQPGPATAGAGALCWVTDASAGQNLQVSDGSAWKYLSLN